MISESRDEILAELRWLVRHYKPPAGRVDEIAFLKSFVTELLVDGRTTRQEASALVEKAALITPAAVTI